MNQKTAVRDLRVPLSLALVLFGGFVGLGVLIMLALKREEYNQSNPPESALVVKNLAIVVFFVFFLNHVIVGFSNEDGFEYFMWLGLPAGMLLGKILLADKNIQLLSKSFWQNLNLDLTKLAEQMANKPQSSLSRPAPTSSSNNHQAINSNPIVIDQSGDRWRIIMLTIAVIFILLFVSGYIAFDAKKAAEERARAVELEMQRAEAY